MSAIDRSGKGSVQTKFKVTCPEIFEIFIY